MERQNLLWSMALLASMPAILYVFSRPDFDVPHCGCRKAKVDGANRFIHPLITHLKKTTFFRIFKVNLMDKCPLWDSNSMCFNEFCSVLTCDEKDIPKSWQTPKLKFSKIRFDENDLHLKWKRSDDLWTDFSNETEGTYVDLSLNPHGDTRYVGKAPRRIWSAISKMCLIEEKKCLETDIFQRIISGMRSSVSAHVAWFSYKNGAISPDFDRYRALSRNKGFLQNLYFSYVFLARAVTKAERAIEDFEYNTGDADENKETKELVSSLLHDSEFYRISRLFRESVLFQGDFESPKIAKYREHFRKVSRVLNCVECEKCQMYGKLQILGFGTALKILLAKDDSLNLDPARFSRDEIFSLVLTLAEFSESVKILEDFEKMERSNFKTALLAFAGGFFVLWAVVKSVIEGVRQLKVKIFN